MRYYLFLLPVCILAALLGAEIYFRFTDGPRYSSANGRWLEPYLGFGNFKEGGSPSSPPSTAGYIPEGLIYRWRPEPAVSNILSRAPAIFGEQYPVSPGRNSKWIVVMGGSAAMGDGDPRRKFPELLEEELNQSEPGLKVLTAAVRSFVSTQERVALELYVLPLRPEAVVFLHGFNDLNPESMARPGDPYNLGVTYARQENFFFGLLQLLSNHSRLVDRLLIAEVYQNIGDSRFGMREEEKETLARSTAEVFEDNVRHMAKRCEQEKTHCLFLFQPFRDFREGGWDDVVRRGYRKVAESFRRRPLRGMAAFHDLAPLYENRRELFVDEVHMNGAGQETVAKAAAGLLKAMGFKQSRGIEAPDFSSSSRANP